MFGVDKASLEMLGIDIGVKIVVLLSTCTMYLLMSKLPEQSKSHSIINKQRSKLL